MDKAHSEKKKNYYKEGMEMLFQKEFEKNIFM